MARMLERTSTKRVKVGMAVDSIKTAYYLLCTHPLVLHVCLVPNQYFIDVIGGIFFYVLDPIPDVYTHIG